MYEHGKNRQFVQLIIYIYIYSVKFFGKLVWFNMFCRKYEETHRNYADFQILRLFSFIIASFPAFLLQYACFCYNHLETRWRWRQKRKSTSSGRCPHISAAAPRIFLFPEYTPAPLGLLFVSVPLAVFFDFILNFCYNIYIKQRK